MAGYRSDGKKDFAVCGWCAAKEIIEDQTWESRAITQQPDILAAAREFASKNTINEIREQLAVTLEDVGELLRRIKIEAGSKRADDPWTQLLAKARSSARF